MAQDVRHDDADAIKAADLVNETAGKIMGHVQSFRKEASDLVTSRGFEGDAALMFLEETEALADPHAKRLMRRIEFAVDKLRKTEEVLAGTNETLASDAKGITKVISING